MRGACFWYSKPECWFLPFHWSKGVEKVKNVLKRWAKSMQKKTTSYWNFKKGLEGKNRIILINTVIEMYPVRNRRNQISYNFFYYSVWRWFLQQFMYGQMRALSIISQGSLYIMNNSL